MELVLSVKQAKDLAIGDVLKIIDALHQAGYWVKVLPEHIASIETITISSPVI